MALAPNLRVSNSLTSSAAGVEVTAKVYKACAHCHEPNPSMVACVDCHQMNHSGQPCRNCGHPGAFLMPVWEVCPQCGKDGVIIDHGLILAWYANPFKQLRRLWTEFRERRQALRRLNA